MLEPVWARLAPVVLLAAVVLLALPTVGLGASDSVRSSPFSAGPGGFSHHPADMEARPAATDGPALTAAAVTSMATSPTGASAAKVVWTNITAHQATSPTGRVESAMVYDAVDGVVVLFGGYSAAGTYLNDTWAFTSHGWTRIVTSTAPNGRADFGLIYDAADREVILVGGTYKNPNGTTTDLNDTWAYVAGHWTRLSSGALAAPPARESASFVYDDRDGYAVYFGGYRYSSGHWLNDTWTFVHGSWTNITVGSPRAPSPRSGANVAFDAADGYVVLYGGFYGSTYRYGDCWKFVGGRWSPIVVATPPGRESSTMAYDAAYRAVLLTGGGTAGTSYQDTWAFQGGTWNQLTTATPGIRGSAAMAYDDALAETILFSGACSFTNAYPSVCDDTWAFQSAGIAWTGASIAPSPTARTAATMAYDPTVGRVVLFGGESNPGGHTVFLNDTWEYGPAGWVQLHLTVGPSVRSHAAMTYDAGDGMIVLFGGQDPSALGDTWTFAHGLWSPLVPSAHPTPRLGAAFAYDPIRNTSLLFGGETLYGPSAETWTFAGGTWTNLTSSLSISPSGRHSASAVYNPLARAIVLFGGIGTALDRDTWLNNASGWTLLSTPSAPPARETAAFVADPLSGAIVLIGGLGSSGVLSDEWAFVAGSWLVLNPVSGPGALSGAVIAFDPSLNVGVLFGGVTAHTRLSGASWILDP